MGRWALIDAINAVVNVIEWDGVAPYTPPAGLTMIATNGQACGPGFTYDPATGTFVEPPPPPPPDAP